MFCNRRIGNGFKYTKLFFYLICSTEAKSGPLKGSKKKTKINVTEMRVLKQTIWENDQNDGSKTVLDTLPKKKTQEGDEMVRMT